MPSTSRGQTCGVGKQTAKFEKCYGISGTDYEACVEVDDTFRDDDCETVYKKTALDDDTDDTPWAGPYNNYNQTYKVASLPKAYYLPSGMAVCVKECPTENNFDEFICEYDYQAQIDELMASDSAIDNALAITYGLAYVSKKVCLPKVETYDYMGYCMPVMAQDALEVAVNQAMVAQGLNATEIKAASEKDWWEMFQADFFKSYGVILGRFDHHASVGSYPLTHTLHNIPRSST